MNLRDIKKEIEYVLAAVIEDCSLVATVNTKANDAAEELIEQAVALYNELRVKANAKVDKKERRAYYNALRKEVLTRTDELYTKLSAAVKETVK